MHPTRLYKLLSDDTRLRMLLLLRTHRLCVCEMEAILKVPQPRISKNLSKFKDLDLVSFTRVDKFIYYSLSSQDPLVHDTLTSLASHLDRWPQLKADALCLKNQEYTTSCDLPLNGGDL